MHIGEIIKEYRNTHGLSMQEFGKKAGISRAYISVLEKNKDPRNGKPIIPSVTVISKVAKAIGVPFDEVFNKLDDELIVSVDFSENPTILDKILETSRKLNQRNQEAVLTYASDKLDEQNASVYETLPDYDTDGNKIYYNQDNQRLYPVVATEKAAAGPGYYYSDDNEQITYYTTDNNLPRFDFATQVSGDSMEPRLHDGEVALFQLGYQNDDSIYLIDWDGKSYIKKIKNCGQNKLKLVSLNPDYDDIPVYLDEGTYFNIIGKLVDSFEPEEPAV